LFDRVAGGLPPRLMTIVLTALGIGWQFGNIEKWAQLLPRLGGVSGAGKNNQAGPTMP
jgi:hypothetical protein